MNEQFKTRILDYLVGECALEKGNDNLRISQYENFSSSIYDSLSELDNYFVYGITNDQNNNYIILYGDYEDTKGFIALADYNFQTIEVFTTYEGGTDLPIIKYLTYADDGTFFGISENTSGTQYLLMLNNFTLTLTGTYSVKFRQSYELDGDLQDAVFGIHGSKVFKKIESAEYIFVAPLETTSSSIDSVIVSTVQINVGSENEWTHTTYTTDLYWNQVLNGFNAFETFASWVDDNYYVKFGGAVLVSGYFHYQEYKSVNSGTISTYTSSFLAGNLHLQARGGIVMPSYDNTYVGTSIRSVEPKTYNIWKVNNDETLIYRAIDDIASGGSSYFMIKYNNNRIIFAESSDLALGIIINDKPYVIGSVDYIYENSDVFITTQFNLNYIYIYDSGYIQKNTLIYNPNNYLGSDYENVNSMIPQSGIIFDENSKIIFARNIYNKVVNGNTTESVIEIPNTYLNDNVFSLERLLSQTNSILNENEQTITKNIYEEVYLNFFNTINIINKNDEDNPITNVVGASRLNQSISGFNSYSKVKMTNLKINYTDNTNRIIESFKLTQNDTTSYTIEFDIYVNKEISNIQFISNDGNTVYQTISPTLEVGKTYKITQDVSVE